MVDKATEMETRLLLWGGHGHLGIYGDDGEMQCGECRADYLRDNLALVARHAITALHEQMLDK